MPYTPNDGADYEAPHIPQPAAFPSNVWEAAHLYRILDYVPFPTDPQSKRPSIKGYKELKLEDITDFYIDQQWANGQGDRGIALLMQPGQVVVDLDSKSDKGESARAWLEANPELAHVPWEFTANGAHLFFLCDDLPPIIHPHSGRPYGKNLVAKIDEKAEAELIHPGLQVTVSPTARREGDYHFMRGGEIPKISWSDLQRIFGFQLPEHKTRTKQPLCSVQNHFRGDLSTLDVVGLFREAHLYGRALDDGTSKHSVQCPFHHDHSDKGEGWSAADTSTIIYGNEGDGPPGFNCFHAHCEDHGIAAVLEALEKETPGIVDRHCIREHVLADHANRPRILHPGTGRPHSEFAREVAEVVGSSEGFFVRGDHVVELVKDGTATRLDLLKPITAITSLERYAEFGIMKAGNPPSFLATSISEQNAKILLENRDFMAALPDIRRVLEVPVPVLHEGKIMLPAPGYDAALATFVAPGAPQPVPMSMTEAVEVLDDLLGDTDNGGFAFADARAKSVAIARLLTPYCRGLIDWAKTPVFIFFGNQPRVGKDTLAKIPPLLMQGRNAVYPPLDRGTDDEMRKRITSDLVTGDPFIHIANLKGHINFPSLEAATDDTVEWHDRMLGFTRKLRLPNEAEYSFSANTGATWTPDIEGRALVVFLEYPGEQPNLRTFRHPDIESYILENRERILGALQALVEHWDKSGRPPGPTKFASFRRWAQVVPGIMHAAGLGDPCVRDERLATVAGDRDTEDIRTLYRLAFGEHGDAAIGKNEIYNLVEDAEEPMFAFLDLNTPAGKTALGKKLKQFDRRELSGIRMDIDYSDKHRLRYRFSRSNGGGGGGDGSGSGERAEPGGDTEPDRAPETTEPPPTTENPPEFTEVKDTTTLGVLLEELSSAPGAVALDIETFGPAKEDALNPERGTIRLLSLALPNNAVWLIDVPALKGEIEPLFEELEHHEIVGHNLAFDLRFLRRHLGFLPQNVFCTMIASRVLEAGRDNTKHELEDVLQRQMGTNINKEQQASDWSVDNLTPAQLEYAANDVAHLHELHAKLTRKLENAGLTRAARLDMNTIRAAVDMSCNGFAVDPKVLADARDAMEQDMADAKEHLAKLVGREINPGSHKQVKELLQSRGYQIANTKEDTLLQLDDPVVDAILRYRQAQTRRASAGGYLKAIREDGRIHAKFDPAGARTGRFSCAEPNIQNIPRGPIRKAFVAPAGKVLVRADYSQVELRIAATITGDKRMLKAFQEGTDIHTQTAGLLLNKAPEEVTAEERTLAKAINFGNLFGQGAKGLQKEARGKYGVRMTLKEAERFQKQFFDAYPGLKGWHDNARTEAGGATMETRTVTGRRRILPAYRPKNRADRGTWWPRFSTMVNTPIQGGAADGMKAALCQMVDALPDTALMVATVHDEIVIECPKKDAKVVSALVEEHMLTAMAELYPAVPFEVDVDVRESWGE